MAFAFTDFEAFNSCKAFSLYSNLWAENAYFPLYSAIIVCDYFVFRNRVFQFGTIFFIFLLYCRDCSSMMKAGNTQAKEDMDMSVDFGEKLRRARRLKGISQQ